jgi:heterodisulfide reductase subunit C
MKATAHWLELKGHTEKSNSMVFDEVFSEQVIATGKIEDGATVRRFFSRTGQKLTQDWLVEMVKSMLRHLPVTMLMRMGLASIVAPRTRGWKGAQGAMEEYLEQQQEKQRHALGLNDLVAMAQAEISPATTQQAE